MVGQFLGDSPPFSQVQGIVRQIRGRRDRVDVTNLENGTFLFKFDNSQTREWVLEDGPWFIAQRPLLLQKWVAGISPEALSSSKIPIWINLKGIPMELFTSHGISHIASGVGFPLFMDKATEMRNRLSFAKVCVEVKKGASLPSSIHVDIEGFGSVDVTVIYPWKPKYCSICKRTGHEASVCRNYTKEWRPVPPTIKVGAAGTGPEVTKSGVEGDAKKNEDEVTKNGEKDAVKLVKEVLQEDKARNATTHSQNKAESVQKEKFTTPLSVSSTNTPKTNSHSLNKGKTV